MSPSDAELRVRQALAAGEAPDAEDVRGVLDDLDRARAESEERWQEIGRLAPRAKSLRATTLTLQRALGAIRQHLDELETLTDDALDDWRRKARALVSQGGPTSE